MTNKHENHLLTIIQITDLHFNLAGDDLARLNAVINHINNNIFGEKILILTGDLVSKKESSLYKRLAEIICTIGCDTYVIPGNHDNREILKNLFYGDRLFHNKELHAENWVSLLLDSSYPGKNLGSGMLPQSELDFLDKKLLDNKEKNALLFIHHPPILFGAKWFQNICLENVGKFDEIVKKHKNVRAIIFGHAHTQHSSCKNNILYVSAPSICFQFDHSVDDHTVTKNTNPGYNWYKLHKDGSLIFGTSYVPITS